MREKREQISMNLADTACGKRRKHNEQWGFCQHFFQLTASLRILAFPWISGLFASELAG
jgi:hypothetical protein